MSLYLTYEANYQRLKNEWLKHNGLIVAYDIDSTVLPYHENDNISNYLEIHQLLVELKHAGCTLVVFTAAEENRHEAIKKQLEQFQLPYDYFNETPNNISNRSKSGKVYANIYLDDRAGLFATLPLLQELLKEIKTQQQ